MKRHSIQLLAILASLTASSNGATLFTEDFLDNSANPNMALGAVFGSPTTTTTGSFTITSGDSNRIYLGTNNTDYSTIDFTFEADVFVPNLGSPWGIAFFGMGSRDAGGGFGEPTSGSNLMMALRGTDDSASGSLTSRDNGVAAPAFLNIGLTATTHGMRMDWNATTMQATFLFDLGNDGTYDPALTFTRDGSNNSFTASNSQLFLGGGNGLSFDNISVTSPIPEPSAVLLGGLGVLGLLRRRRI
jgi:MYXO-CTERM domain-containing protein